MTAFAFFVVAYLAILVHATVKFRDKSTRRSCTLSAMRHGALALVVLAVIAITSLRLTDSAAYAALSLVALIVVGEVILKAGLPIMTPHNKVYRFHPYKVYEIVPEGFWRFGVKHNKAGFRGPDIEKKKPDGVIRIFLVGGSTTWDGNGDGGKHTRDFLQEELESEFPDGKFEIVNCALPGYQSMQTVILTASDLVDYSPDIIVFMHGINDSEKRLLDAERADFSGTYQPFIYPERSLWERSTLLSMAFVIYNNFDNLWFPNGPYLLEHLTLKPEYQKLLIAGRMSKDVSAANLKRSGSQPFRRNLITMVGLGRIHDFVPLFCTAPFMVPDNIPEDHSYGNYLKGIMEHNDETRSVAADYGLPCVDLAEKYIGKQELFDDAIHMNGKGQMLKANDIAKAVGGIVKNIKTSQGNSRL